MKTGKKLSLVFGLVWKISPAYFFLLLFQSVSFSGQILTNVIFPKYLIHELLGARDPATLVLWVALIAGSNFLFTFLKKTGKRLTDVKSKEVNCEIERAFARKVMSVEYRKLEDPAYLDLKERASFAMNNQSAVRNLIDGTVTFLNQLFTVAGLIAIMLRLSFVLVLSLAATVALTILIYSSFSGYTKRFFTELIPVNRRYGYYVGLTYQKAIQKDARLYGMNRMLSTTVTKYNREVTRWLSFYYRRMGLYLGLFQVITILESVIAYAFVSAKTLGDNGVGIGDLTMYVNSAVNFASSVIALGTAVVTIVQMLGYLDPFAQLMSEPDEEIPSGTRKLERVESVVFEHVNFTYPGTDRKTLDDLSFSISGGERIGIVGRNGAGKSTVVKLLCRLYRPDSGRILVNGREIGEYDRASFLAGIAAVFQDFRLFNFSIEENVTCRLPGEDTVRAEEILAGVGVGEKIASLPNGVSSFFGREYDREGVEFSGGQSQKIAIARALYKDASFVILDEPTSALDPKAEAEIYENFHSLAGGRTAVFISHRMSSSVFCDRILVLKDGRVEAFDTHANLMKNEEGTYYTLFHSQAENYQLGGDGD